MLRRFRKNGETIEEACSVLDRPLSRGYSRDVRKILSSPGERVGERETKLEERDLLLDQVQDRKERWWSNSQVDVYRSRESGPAW